jgi:hypothetical protein
VWTSESEQELSHQTSGLARESRMPYGLGHRRPVVFPTAEHLRRAAGFLAPHPSMTPVAIRRGDVRSGVNLSLIGTNSGCAVEPTAFCNPTPAFDVGR